MLNRACCEGLEALIEAEGRLGVAARPSQGVVGSVGDAVRASVVISVCLQGFAVGGVELAALAVGEGPLKVPEMPLGSSMRTGWPTSMYCRVEGV